MIDHRWSQRVDTDLEVRIATLDGVTAQGRIRNISLYGVYVETACCLDANNYVHLYFELPGNPHNTPCEIGAVIIHSNAQGMGMMVDTTVADADTVMRKLKRCFGTSLFPACGKSVAPLSGQL